MNLGVKLGRRLMAVAAIRDERIEFHDSRFVPSRRSALAPAISRYLRQVLDQLKPAVVYYYAPTGPKTVTEELVRLLETEAATSGIPAKSLTKSDVFGSFGVVPLRTRQALRDQLLHLWPTLHEEAKDRQIVLAEAAAAALVGDLYQEWPPA